MSRLRFFLLPLIICAIFAGYNANVMLNNDSNNYDYGSAVCEKNISYLGKYSTEFDTQQLARVDNIIVAANRLNGVVIKSNEEFSFNETTKFRTLENGYKESIVIDGGRYVLGVGGGVCQVSTTLYNAWIRSGLEVVSVKGHSLPSHYVEPSLDATVSSSIDLVLRNNTAQNIQLQTSVIDNELKVNVIGSRGKYQYKVFSEVIKEVLPIQLPDIVIKVQDEIDVGYESNIGESGCLSRAVVEMWNGGKLISRREVRRDYYKAIDIQGVRKELDTAI